MTTITVMNVIIPIPDVIKCLLDILTLFTNYLTIDSIIL